MSIAWISVYLAVLEAKGRGVEARSGRPAVFCPVRQRHVVVQRENLQQQLHPNGVQEKTKKTKKKMTMKKKTL
jgi:hypothetical protein